MSYIVKTSADRCPSSWKWQHELRRVGVLEVVPGTKPTMISERARGVRRVVKTWERCYVGTTARCEYERAVAEARVLAARLNIVRVTP